MKYHTRLTRYDMSLFFFSRPTYSLILSGIFLDYISDAQSQRLYNIRQLKYDTCNSNRNVLIQLLNLSLAFRPAMLFLLYSIHEYPLQLAHCSDQKSSLISLIFRSLWSRSTNCLTRDRKKLARMLHLHFATKSSV